MKKTLICGLLTITTLLLLFSLFSCGKKEITLGDRNGMIFTVVYGADPAEKAAAEALSEALRTALGCEVTCLPDTDPEQKNEILVGKTSRAASGKFAGGLNEGEYGFLYEGGKLLLCGDTPERTETAVQAFLAGYLKEGETMEKLVIPADLSTIEKEEDAFKWLSLKEAGIKLHRFDPSSFISDWLGDGSLEPIDLLSPTGRTGTVTGDTYDYNTHPADYQVKTTDKLTDGEEESIEQGMALWAGNKKTPDTDTYINYDLGELYYICYYQLRPSFAGMEWEVEYSEDGEYWDCAEEYTSGEWIHSRTFSEPFPAQYVRFHITKGAVTGNDFFVAIREIWMQGVPAAGLDRAPTYISPFTGGDGGDTSFYYDYGRSYVTADLGKEYEIAAYAFDYEGKGKDVKLLTATDPTVWQDCASGKEGEIAESGRRYVMFSARGGKADDLTDIRLLVRDTENRKIRTLKSGNTTASFVMPVPADAVMTDLTGEWEISSAPKAGFWKDSSASRWKKITVPSYPELNGVTTVSEKEYNHEYAYRKTVPSPLADECDRYFLRFDSVLNVARVWVNGVYLGSHSGGYTAFEFEITDLVKTGDDLEIVVGVTSVTYAPELNIGGSGITGAVRIEGVKEAHLTRLHSFTSLGSAYENGEITLNLAADLGGKETVTASLSLTDPEGKDVASGKKAVTFAAGAEEQTVTIPISDVITWDAEHPRLYTLRVTLDGGAEYEQKIGIREVKLTDSALLVNGSPVKLRGVDWTDLDPTGGLVSSPEYDRESLIKLKQANVNYIRTSHFPPSDEILSLCDSLGFYVELEATHHINTHWATGDDYERLDTISNPQYLPWTLGVYASVFERAEPHSSIVIWSVSNESDYGGNTEKVCEYLERVDDSRPVKFSWGDSIPAGTDLIDVKSVHYPSLDSLKKAAPMPTIYDECGHLYHTVGIDAGLRALYGYSYDAYWEAILKQKGGLGAAIWHSRDFMFFGENGHFTFNTTWGLLDCWGREKPEYYSVKKVYSPLDIDELQTLTAEGKDGVTLSVGNRYFHTSLSELVCVWTCGEEKGEITLPDTAPGMTAKLTVPVKNAENGAILHLDFIRRQYEAVENYVVDSYEFKLGGWTAPAYASAAEGSAPEIADGTAELTVTGEGFTVKIAKNTGKITASAGGKTVMNGSPVLILNGEKQSGLTGIKVTAVTEGSEAVVEMTGKYASGVMMTFRLSIDREGRIGFGYAFPEGKTYEEIGVTLPLSENVETLSWEGRPVLWSVYPEYDIGRITGTAKRICGGEAYGVKPDHPWSMDETAYEQGKSTTLPASRDFLATRFGVDTASLTDKDGKGVRIEADGIALRAEVEGKDVSVTLLSAYSALGATDEMGDVTPIPLTKTAAAESGNIVGSFVIRLIG